MRTPEVTVVMSVYNGAGALDATLGSLMAQTGCDFEVLAVDDGSTDGSAALLESWAARTPQLRVIHQANQGLTRALVLGCSAARGEFIARQDVGDISLPGRLAAQAALLRADSKLAFVACRHELVGPAGEPLGVTPPGPAQAEGLRNRDGRVLPNPAHGSVMFRKSDYLAAGGYRPEFYFAQDVDLWSRLIAQGDFACVPQVLYQVTVDLHGISAHHRESQQRLRALIMEAAALRDAGGSDAEVLQRAARIRPAQKPASRPPAPAPSMAAAYFVGSCLARQRDVRAKGYLREVLRHHPLHLKSWLKLAYVTVAARP
jgi:glycosyltransferase involved in cell wall biosynthesis